MEIDSFARIHGIGFIIFFIGTDILRRRKVARSYDRVENEIKKKQRKEGTLTLGTNFEHFSGIYSRV